MIFFHILDCLKRIKDVRADQKKIHTDLKKDIEYLWSDKKLADEKKKDLRTKKANQQDLLDELVCLLKICL
jgi:hypothetical protein